MEKVKVTREQAKALEELEEIKHKELAVKSHINGWFVERRMPLNDLSLDQFIRALYIGYEVEPEFKVGDWVVNTSSGYIKLIENEREANFLNNDYIKYHELRHATPEEIAAEKERRWWAKHGRDVWELREGDVLVSDEGEFQEVTTVKEIEGFHFIDYVKTYIKTIKRKYRVVCFAENRLDVKQND